MLASNDFEGFPPPTAFGLPEKFSSWRTEQLLAIDRAVKSKKRFTCHALPTGAGKSIVGVAAAIMAGWRVVYLTSTKGLQKQLTDDFQSIGLKDIRGQGNYSCMLLNETDYSGMCDHGPCHAGFPCEYRNSGCYYFDSVKRAKISPLVVSNYAYWIRINRFADTMEEGRQKEPPLGKRDLLVMDEVHHAPDELSEAMSFNFSKQETDGILCIPAPWETEDVAVWIKWSRAALVRADQLLEQLTARVKASPYSSERRTFKRLKDVKRKLIDLYSVEGDWIAYITKGHTITFSPLWPHQYRSKLMLKNIPRVLLLSATVRPKTAHLLGIGDGEMDFYDYDSSFPADRRPVIHIPTVRMNHRISDEGLRTWLDRIDQIIKRRLDRKGIVHTTSYERRNLITQFSKYRDQMMSHDSHNTVSVVHQFKEAAPPAILVSPSVSTGWDFPDSDCRYQIVAKIPFVDTRDKITRARCEADPEYSPYSAAQILIQSSGRSTRNRDDWSEVFIIDDNVKWFIKSYKRFFPTWWLNAYKTENTIPTPPPLEGI